MNITEASRLTGLSIDTIRYYERSAMLPPLTRDARGWRHFDGNAIEWLRILERLRATGMPTDDMRRFARLVFAAEADAPDLRAERLAILQRHKSRLKQRARDLRACQDYVDMKIRIYSELKESSDD
jgi:DNA-binding transcriptional MerR regulator